MLTIDALHPIGCETNLFDHSSQDICQSALLYTDMIHGKMKKSCYFDDEGQFDVHKPVCYIYIIIVMRELFPPKFLQPKLALVDGITN